MSNEPTKTENLDIANESWPYNQLKDLDKVELERRKLILEVANYNLNKVSEKRKTRINNVRNTIFFLLPLLISLLTTFFYWKADRENAQTDLARKAFDDYENKFFAAKDINDSIKSVSQMAGFSNIMHDTSIQSKIDKYAAMLETLTNIRNERQKNLIVQQNNHDAKVDSAKQYAPKRTTADIKYFEKLDTDKINAQNAALKKDQPAEVAANKSANQVTNDIPAAFKPAVYATQNITDSLIKQFNAAPAKTDETVIKDYGTSWFKVGYFLQFDDMRVLLQYEDKRLGIQVEICQTTSSALCDNPVKTKQWISYDAPLTVAVGGAVYKISLQTIDHAGANPFKLAAYIKVVKLK